MLVQPKSLEKPSGIGKEGSWCTQVKIVGVCGTLKFELGKNCISRGSKVSAIFCSLGPQIVFFLSICPS